MNILHVTGPREEIERALGADLADFPTRHSEPVEERLEQDAPATGYSDSDLELRREIQLSKIL